jgi:DNA-binding transcriptional ArsR family regulator
MFVVKKSKGEVSSISTKEIDLKQIKPLGSELAHKILHLLAKNPSYPMDLAKQLKVNEQKVYYHIRNLERSRLIEVIKTETVQGAVANFYALVEPSFVVRFQDFETTTKMGVIEEQPKKFLDPFIENGKLNSLIIVGSPDPHGPEKARSRDGYYGIDLGLFLGTFLNYIPSLNVKLDTETREEDLKQNLILIGGPVVNTITGKINSKLPIKFDKDNNWNIVSSISKKTYHSDEMGVIVKMKNPFNSKKSILLVAGKRYSGTRAVMIAFLKHFKEIFAGNKYNNKILAKVVEGIDLDSDGQVDEIEILE